jgi:hypothetical protein
LTGLALSGGTGLSRLFDHPCSQAVHLLIHCLFNLGQRGFGMGRSPLRYSGKHLLTLFFPPFL